ncbi:MAG: hypothetical protein JXP73_22485 [Deltaproteobacteria bacterium]|nr:hypothetical protein [Deltaproteobacteria bacterium]
MDRKLMASIEVVAGQRASIPSGRGCALLSALLLAACGGGSDKSTDAGKDASPDSTGRSDTGRSDATTSDVPLPQDAPVGCSVGGQSYTVGQTVVIPGNCPTTCVCLAGGALGSCYSNCATDGGATPDSLPSGDGAPAITCSWGGGTYTPGQKLPLNDGCGGYCVCLADGTVGACTEACPVDAGPESARRDAPVDQPPPPVDAGCPSGAACTLANGNHGYCSAAGVCSACSGAQADTRCATAYGTGYVCVSGQCVSGCNNSGQCTGGRLCDTATHTCVACNVSTVDAGDPVAAADNRCKNDTNYGPTTICLNGACTTGDCHDSTDCNTGRICGASVPNACGDCSTDQQCRQDSRYGTGHICVGNLCVQGDCHDTDDCTTAGQVCNAATHTCGACTSDTQCAAEYANRPICVTTTGLTTTGLCVANTNLCPADNVTCPRNSSDFCCDGACVPGNCCVTADCTAIDDDYVCQDHICTHCDAISGNSYLVDPVNGDDTRANGSGRAGGAAAAECAFKTLTKALQVVGTPTAATTITIVGPSEMGAASSLNGETLPFEVRARVTITTQGGAVTLSLRAGENGFSFLGGTGTAGSALSPASGAVLTIDRPAGTSVEPGYGIHVEPTGTGTITIANVTVNHAGGGTANAAVEIAGGTVAMSNVTVSNATTNGIRITGGTTTLSNVTVGTASTNGASNNGIAVSGGSVTINQGVRAAYADQNGLAVSGGTVSISNGTATNTPTRFNNNGESGISVSGTAVLDLAGAISGTSRSVVTQDNTGSNVRFASTSATTSSINGLYSFGSDADGLLIQAGSRIRVRNSTCLGNAGNGIHIVTSGSGPDDDLEAIDLGTGTDTGTVRGRNTLQVASPAASQNVGAGLCIGALTDGAGAQTLSAQANLFAGVDCGTTTPGAITVSTTCTGNADLGILDQPDGVSVTVGTDNCTQ